MEQNAVLNMFKHVHSDQRAVAGSLDVRWARSNVGWGELRLYVREDGQLGIANEHMSREFIVGVLAALVDKAVLDDER